MRIVPVIRSMIINQLNGVKNVDSRIKSLE